MFNSREEARRFLQQNAEATISNLEQEVTQMQADAEQQMQQLVNQPRSEHAQELIEKFTRGLTDIYREHSQKLLEETSETIRRQAREF